MPYNGSMFATPIRTAAYQEIAGTGRESRSTIVTRILLVALLMLSTITIFVEAVWPLAAFEIAVYLLVAAYSLMNLRREESFAGKGFFPSLVYLIPVWGTLQLATHKTASTFDTRASVLMWASLAGVFFLTRAVARSVETCQSMLGALLTFATGMAVLCLAQRFTSEGRVLWFFSSGYPDIFAAPR